MQAHAKTPTSPTRADLSQTPADMPLIPTPHVRADLRSDRKEFGDVPSPTPSQAPTQAPAPKAQTSDVTDPKDPNNLIALNNTQTAQQTQKPNDQKTQGCNVNDPNNLIALNNTQTARQTQQPNNQNAQTSNVTDPKDSNNLKVPTDQSAQTIASINTIATMEPITSIPPAPADQARADLRSDHNKIGDVPSPTSTAGQFSMLRVSERRAVLALTMPSVSNFDRRPIFKVAIKREQT